MNILRIFLLFVLCGTTNISQAIWNRFTSVLPSRFASSFKNAFANKKRIVATTAIGTGITALGFTGYHELMYRNAKYGYKKAEGMIEGYPKYIDLVNLSTKKLALDNKDLRAINDFNRHLWAAFVEDRRHFETEMELYKKRAYFTRGSEFTQKIFAYKRS